MATQHSHHSTPFSKQRKDLILLCDGIQSPANIGALFRLSDALGVAKIIFCNTTIDFTSNRLLRTARNTVSKVPHLVSEKTTLSELEALKTVGYTTIALELTDQSTPLKEFSAKTKKIALVIGNERHGVSKDVLLNVDQSIYIEMFGENSSMNVAQATAIALYALT
ncbi:TrmH family RNA methyltransferase [Jejudonia soesokkakensis]|uniref:TrmH family RNA methyltransferase n=1 Tax=Jejudonia soesokkakensis TaxID=1323432 RepID=A0ABW2MTI8_9FLAO